MRLQRIEGSGIRGIPTGWPSLLIGEKGLLLYGPNGTGKTSIVDAIEFLLTNRSTLFAENRLGVNWSAARLHVGATKAGALLGVTNGSTIWDLALDCAPPAPVAEWCQSATKSSFLLRRYMLLRFIDAQPKSRYDQLEPFLNLTEFIAFEERVAELSSTLDAKRAEVRAQVASASQILQSSFDLERTTPPSLSKILAAINGKLALIDIEACTDEVTCNKTSEKVRELIASGKPSERYLCLMRLRHASQQIATARVYSELVDQLVASLKSVEDEAGRHERLVITELLEAAKQVIGANQLIDCPVCEQKIDPTELLRRLQSRIDADLKMTTLRQDARRRLDVLLQAVEAASVAWQNLVKDWEGGITEAFPTVYRNDGLLLGKLTDVLKDAPNASAVAAFSPLIKMSPEDQTELVGQIDALIAAEGDGGSRLILSEISSMLTSMATQWPIFRRKSETLTRLNDMYAKADSVHAHAIAARKEVVQELLDGIAGLANEMYEFVHPEERIATSSLAVRPTEDGSVNLQTKFYGKTASPRLHFSESHLDTLGLCYFLALRKAEATRDPSFRLLVLDDVLHSVDADHRGRVAQLLKRDFSDHQLVVTTHDEIFFARLRAALGNNGFEYQKFHGWDIFRGPISGDKTNDLDLITDATIRMSVSPATLAAACGRVFEWMLMQLTENLQVAIPARFSRAHDIGNMWPPLRAKLKRMKGFAVKYPTLPDDIEFHGWVRNFAGAHYNESSSSCTPVEARDFAILLANLYAATYCMTCDTFITKIADDKWQCDSGCLSYSVQSLREDLTARSA